MQPKHHLSDYEPVLPTRPRRPLSQSPETAEDAWPTERAAVAADDDMTEGPAPAVPGPTDPKAKREAVWTFKRGHGLTYVWLFLFTLVLYARPSEFYPSVLTNSIALIIGLITLAVYVPSQLALDGTLTARPREVNFMLLLTVAALVSILFAKESSHDAWDAFSGTFIRAVIMFIVIVNAVRTEKRLRGLMFLSLGVACVLSLTALNNYRQGNLMVEGYRAMGDIGGMFGNPNDMALHLVTMLPIALALLFATRSLLRRALYGVCAGLLVAGIVVTFSRGGFLALIAVAALLSWKLGRQHRLAVMLLTCVGTVAFLALAPGDYARRILSIFDQSLDPLGSATQRQEGMMQAVKVALRNPLFGIGMNNFRLVSSKELQVHNAYAQVASELGLAAFYFYTMFVVAPYKRLRQVERETFATRKGTSFYYLAIGLEGALVGYMVASFFAPVAYYWNVYYLVGYAVSLRYIYEAQQQSAAAQPAQTAAAMNDAAPPPAAPDRAGFDELAATHGHL